MPGYRSLSSSVIGSAADSAREAESRRRDGDPSTAVALLEEALEASARVTVELPGWLCGRLAALYRTLGRYDDEVQLLERYRESQISEEARSRYDARLSKARTIAERKRRPESGALSSVRKVLGTPRRRSAAASTRPDMGAVPTDRSALDLAALGAAFATPAGEDHEAVIARAVTLYTAAGRAQEVPIEQLVQGLRAASQDQIATAVPATERAERFSAALVRLLAAYFEEDVP